MRRGGSQEAITLCLLLFVRWLSSGVPFGGSLNEFFVSVSDISVKKCIMGMTTDLHQYGGGTSFESHGMTWVASFPLLRKRGNPPLRVSGPSGLDVVVLWVLGACDGHTRRTMMDADFMVFVVCLFFLEGKKNSMEKKYFFERCFSFTSASFLL